LSPNLHALMAVGHANLGFKSTQIGSFFRSINKLTMTETQENEVTNEPYKGPTPLASGTGKAVIRGTIGAVEGGIVGYLAGAAIGLFTKKPILGKIGAVVGATVNGAFDAGGGFSKGYEQAKEARQQNEQLKSHVERLKEERQKVHSVNCPSL